MDFLNALEEMFGAANKCGNSTSNTNSTCHEKVDHYLFYQVTLAPAILITLSFALFKKRRNLFLNVLRGRPGLLYPMDALDRSSRLNYAMAFGATMFLVYAVILEGKFAIDYTGPLALKTLILVVSMLMYGMAFFPIFASLTMGSTFGYGLGALYVWMITIVEIYKLAECSVRWQSRLLLIGRSIPHMFCLLYLSFSIPARFYLAIKKKRYFVKEETVLEAKHTMKFIKRSYQGSHVRKLLKKPCPKPPPPKGICNKILDLAKRFIYQRNEDFRYSSRILSVMVIGVSLLYVISFESIATFTEFCTSLIYWINTILENRNCSQEQNVTEYKSALQIFRNLLEGARICVIVAVIVTFLVGLLMILHMLTSYRKHLLKLYRGCSKDLPVEKRSNPSLLVGYMRYAGYQVAYIAWGFIIQLVIFLVICSFLAIVITLLRHGITQWLLDGVLQIWPLVVWALLLHILQIIVAKFVFLIGHGDILAINNRRFFFIYTYFMFFFNIFLGIVSCLMRIVKAIVLGAIFLPRLDMSTFPRRFEFLDPGFTAYVGYMHVENAHTHPVVIVFLRLMLMNINDERQDMEISMKCNKTEDKQCIQIEAFADEMKDKMVENKRYAVRFKWLVAYTLLNNPQIRGFRKGYIQALAKAVGKGAVVPVSDGPITDLTRIQEPSAGTEHDLIEVKVEGKIKYKPHNTTINNDEECNDSKV